MSIINHEYGHTFIHVPKTAGNSMQLMPWVGNKCHTSASQYIKRGEWREDYFSWGFVRHPLDRLVSAYEWARQFRPNHDGMPKNAVDDFDIYVQWVCRTGGHLNNRPMTEFLCYEGDIAVDFVGRYERLLDGWDHVCWNVLGKPVPLPATNRTVHRHWSSYYHNVDTWERAVEHYSRDFETFGYILKGTAGPAVEKGAS